MIRTLTIVTVAAFFLSVVCLSVAFAIGGPELVSNGVWAWGPWSHTSIHWNHQVTRSFSDDNSTRREQGWSAEALDVDVPADVHFTQADGPAKLVVTGPKSAVDHLIVHDSHITVDSRYPMEDDQRLVVELSAPKVTRFGLHGTGKLDIAGYRQDSLDLQISGDGDVSAQGSARSVSLNISGSGDADLTNVAADRADVSISGAGHAKVAPKSWAKLDISGSGDVDLMSHPGHLESHVSGSGSINQDDASASPSDSPSPSPTPPAKPAKAGKRT